MRAGANAIRAVLRNGLTRRAPPHDVPPLKPVSHYVRLWRLTGTRGRVHDALRDRLQPAVWAAVAGGWVTEPSKKPDGATAFAVLPERWIVGSTGDGLGAERGRRGSVPDPRGLAPRDVDPSIAEGASAGMTPSRTPSYTSPCSSATRVAPARVVTSSLA